jgi:hypothetical protein
MDCSLVVIKTSEELVRIQGIVIGPAGVSSSGGGFDFGCPVPGNPIPVKLVFIQPRC